MFAERYYGRKILFRLVVKLIEKYPNANHYLMRVLFSSQKLWARAFTLSIFTAGMQTTSRVEGYNNIIKRELVACSTLCDLESVLDARLKNEAQWNRF